MAAKIITVIGSLNVDLISRTRRLPSAGETVTGESFTIGAGGKGANQALACQRLSHSRPIGPTEKELAYDVFMVGAVGDDYFSQVATEILIKDGVNVGDVLRRPKPVQTGVACVIVNDETGENQILLSPGANHTLRPEHFETLPSPTPSLIVLQLEIPLDTVVQILKVAAAHKIPVILNAAPAVSLSDDVYPMVSHLIVNESEAAFLAGTSVEDLEMDNLHLAAKCFIRRGTPNVVITLGSKGSFYATQGGEYGLVKAEKVDVVDTTAAGDTFVGMYAASVAAADVGFDIREAVEWSNKAAAITVQCNGAQSAIPWLDDVQKRMRLHG
ncbi:MAG: hypothetical protein M1824_004629 [Vezdaea acicularis]|nr:MAG: hypothetical protein M1824_004629 [Vezdaea acicularis]